MLMSLYRPDPKKHVIRVRARLEAENGDVGDIKYEIRPGETMMGWTYPELLALGNGMHDIEPRTKPRLWPGEDQS